MTDVKELMNRALEAGIVIPGFNIPYLPMMQPIIDAIRNTHSFGLIMVARPEWEKFEAKSLEHVREQYERLRDDTHTRLHLDHVPVIDEDHLEVDYQAIIQRAITLGYHSVMVDGSRLSLDENIACTKNITRLAGEVGIPVEGELGAVLGHEAGPLPPYDELFESGQGFTDVEQAVRFVRETGVDWLSVAVGNIHGAIAASEKGKKKVQARLNIERLSSIRQAVKIPLVLHGGSGIQKEYVLRGIKNGIAKINVGTALRQPYEKLMTESVDRAQQAVYDATVHVIVDELDVGESVKILNPNT